jgi:hypothetical protein
MEQVFIHMNAQFFFERIGPLGSYAFQVFYGFIEAQNNTTK